MVVWDFLKKYWLLLLAGSTALAGFFLGLRLRRPATDVGKEARDAERQTQDKEKELDRQVEKDKQAAVDAHDKEVGGVVKDVEKRTEEIKADPKAVNDYLKEVGNKVREK